MATYSWALTKELKGEGLQPLLEEYQVSVMTDGNLFHAAFVQEKKEYLWSAVDVDGIWSVSIWYVSLNKNVPRYPK